MVWICLMYLIIHLDIFTHESENKNSLTNNNVYGIIKEHDALWILTFGGGLNILSIKTDQFLSLF